MTSEETRRFKASKTSSRKIAYQHRRKKNNRSSLKIA